MAYFELPYAIDPKNPFLLDRRSGPWLSVADALANIPLVVREQGLLVTVKDTTFMYVFEGGVADINLVPLQATTHWGDISGAITNQTDLTPYIIAQARGSITLTNVGSGGASTYNPTTGALNIPSYVTTMSGTVAKTSQYFTATAGQTVFTIVGGYIVGSIDVYLTGVKLTLSEYTATNGSTVTLTAGAGLNDIVEVVIYGIGSFLGLLYATTPLHYDNTSGVFSIQVANGIQSGYLSSTDWLAFTAKLNSFTLTTLGTTGAATWDGATLNIPQYTGGGVDATAVHLAGIETITGNKTFTGATSVTGYSLIARKTLAVAGFGAGINTTTENGANSATPYLQMTLENPTGNKRNVTFMGATLPTGFPDEAYAIYLPNANGTLALLSDITSYTAGTNITIVGGVISSTGGSSITFVDDEVPTGVIDNTNLVFGLAHAPTPVASLKLYLNGQKLFVGDDFTLLGTVVTMVAAAGTGNKLRADYRY
jgi:hypothetical protein